MDENTNDKVVLMSKKASTNRRNAQLSTGPRTEEGKSRSRGNAVKHGVLVSALLITEGQGTEDSAEFDKLLGDLYQNLGPVGALEEMLVERIAVCCWRQKRALRCEAGLVRRAFVPDPGRQKEEAEWCRIGLLVPNPELAAIKDHLSLPLGDNLDRILRYETTIHRQLAYAINQLERLQRARKGARRLACVPHSQVATDGIATVGRESG